MKKLLILALTSAFVAAANADNPNQFGVASTGLSNAEWKQDNQPVERTYTSGVIGIDEEASSPLVLSPTTGFTAPDPQVKTVVTVEATFTAVSDSLVTLTDAKTAFTVANVSGTPRYRYWNGSGWAALDDTVTAVTNSAITIKIELDNSTPNTTEAAFKVNDTQIGQLVTISSDTETTLTGLAFAGTGSLTSVAATVTPAYATTTTKRYASVEAALTDNVAVADMTLHKYGDSFGTMPTDNNKLYFPASVSDNTASLYSFTKVDGDYQINSADDLKALVDLTAYDNTARNFKQTDDITLDTAWPGIGIQNGKDIVGTAAFDNGAFKGTYDGGNHTVSNFQMVDGLDYCGFFNSVSNATIRNLKISYKDGSFAKDMVASKNACGATFVGVAKGSTLQGLTSLAGTVSCTKGFGGIVGYLMGTTVDSCTNNLNMTSLANNQCGGIAMICQQENCSISNCKNTGTMTTGSGEFGGIIGYTDTITISDCENTAACKMFYHHGGTVTLSGTNKGNATVASYTGNATPGLNFATVDGNNVATFAANDALAAGNTYKVMATGATATATLTAGDTISFDENLFTPTYAITAASGLVAPSTSGKVTTYTASTPVPVDGGSTDATLLVSVPQDCKASQLIDTSNRASKDLLRVLNKATNKYYQWEYDGKGGWTPNNVATTDGLDETPAADTVDLTRGEAVWVTRTVTSEPIKLNAVYTDDPVEVAVSSGYNLVAPALKENVTTFALSDLAVKEGSFSDTDMIVIPGAAAPINCVRKDGAWKIYKAESVTDDDSWGGIATGGKYVTPDPIPAGKGFFFVTKEAKTLSL